MTKRKSRLRYSIFILFSGSIIAQMITVAVSPIITRLFTPEAFGQFALYLTYVGIGTVLATLKLEAAFLLPRSFGKARTIFQTALLSAVLAGIVLFIAIALCDILFKDLPVWAWILPIGIVFNAMMVLTVQWLNRLRMYRLMSLGRIFQSTIVAVGSITAGYFSVGALGLIEAHVFGALLLLIVWRRYLPEFKNASIMRKVLKAYHAFPVYTMPHALIGAFSSAVPVLLLTPHFGAGVVGLYALGARVLQVPANMLAQAISNVFNKEASAQLHRKRPILPLVHKIAKGVSLPLMAVAVILAIFAPQAFAFIFGEQWREAGEYVSALVPMVFFTFFSSLFSFIPILFKSQKKSLKIEIAALIAKSTGLLIGIVMNDVMLSMLCYSLLFSLVTLYKIGWMYYICRQYDVGCEWEGK